MGTRFNKARFHISSGPEALFERVRFVMSGRKELRLHARHFQERADERDAPLDRIKSFDSSEWKLETAEVRTDTGKFINSTWSLIVRGSCWRVVIGLHDTVETIIRADKAKSGFGDSIVRSGEVYDFVAKVNRELMQAESKSRR